MRVSEAQAAAHARHGDAVLLAETTNETIRIRALDAQELDHVRWREKEGSRSQRFQPGKMRRISRDRRGRR